MTEEEINDLLLLIYHEPVEYLLPASRTVLPMLLTQHPELESVFRKLLSKQTKSANYRVSEGMALLLDDLEATMNFTSDSSYWKVNENTFGCAPEEVLVRSWAIGSITDDLGRLFFNGRNLEPILDELIGMRDMLYGYDGQPDYSRDTDYWRGMCILYGIWSEIEVNFNTDSEREDAHEFVLWVGKRPDPRAIVDLCRDHKTIAVTTLETLLDLSKDSPVLINGAL